MQIHGRILDLKERAFLKAPQPIVVYDGSDGILCAYNEAAISLLGLPESQKESIAIESVFNEQSVALVESCLGKSTSLRKPIRLTAISTPKGEIDIQAMCVQMGESHKKVLSLYIQNPGSTFFNNGSDYHGRSSTEQRLNRTIDKNVIRSIDVVCQGFIIYSVVKELLAHQTVAISYQQFPDGYDPDAILEKQSDVLIFAFPNVSNAEIQAIKDLMKAEPTFKVLVLTMRAHDRTLSTLIRLGVRGVISEEKDFQLLTAAANAIGNGELWFSRSVLQQIFESLKHSELHRGDQDMVGALSDRELEILKLIAVGLKNTQIADKLHISYSTVASHVYNIFRKLDINNRAEAIHYAVSRGLI